MILFSIIILVVSAICLTGCKKFKTTRIDNFLYMITIEYPENWKAVKTDYIIEGEPTRYKGKDGFFQMSAIIEEDLPIEEIASNEAHNELNLYGSNPKIKEETINNNEFVFIFPSPDQSVEMNNQACFIIKYPQIVRIADERQHYFMLQADKRYIRDIAKSLYFIVY
ncbi:MAG: hypothetical protein ISS13_04590 [Actinobacteria bacterium]|nr:hypothetical protein [Actinomycetota bacterium]